jgi:hypothetical protein
MKESVAVGRRTAGQEVLSFSMFFFSVFLGSSNNLMELLLEYAVQEGTMINEMDI